MRTVRILVMLVALSTLASCSDTGKPKAASSSGRTSAVASSTAPACSRPHTSGQSEETFEFDGEARTYQLYVPAAYTGATPVPVVFDFHGFGSNAVEQMAYGNFKPEADRDDFLIVAPDGQDGPGGRHFNLTGESGLQDDVAMVSALLDHAEATFCVDPKRVFATGMSDGGAMSSFLACKSSDRFAAFAPVAVVLFVPGCTTSHPIAFSGFSGTADPVVPFDGGPVHCCGGVSLPPPSDSMANWANHEGCAPEFHDEQIGTEVRKRTWAGCHAGSEVVFYIIDGGGHTWPGGIPVDRLGKTTTQLDASETIWEFFQAHPLP